MSNDMEVGKCHYDKEMKSEYFSDGVRCLLVPCHSCCCLVCMIESGTAFTKAVLRWIVTEFTRDRIRMVGVESESAD